MPLGVFIHLQTVWEGTHTNTPARGPRETKKYGIKAPVGFDGHGDGSRTSIFMSTVGTGGTPWTVIIDKKRVVRVNGVSRSSADDLVDKINQMRRGR